MQYAYITFWDEEEKPIRITKEEYEAILKVWVKAEHLIIKGNVIHKKAIKRIKPPEKPEPLMLAAPEGKAPTKEFLASMKERIMKKFSTK